jgi:hypothetical protein
MAISACSRASLPDRQISRTVRLAHPRNNPTPDSDEAASKRAIRKGNTMPSTTTLGQFVSHISPNRQSRTLSVSRLGSRDYIGTMITGRLDDCARIMKQVAGPPKGPGP